jgi:hypothetical protein
MLVTAGSPVNVVDASGRTPLDLLIVLVRRYRVGVCLTALTQERECSVRQVVQVSCARSMNACTC